MKITAKSAAKSNTGNLFVFEANDQRLLEFTPDQWQRFGTALLSLSAVVAPEVVVGALVEVVEGWAAGKPMQAG